MRKIVKSHLLITLLWLVLMTLLRWDWQINLIFLWAGGLLGAFLLDIDHLFYTLWAYPQELTSMRVGRLVNQRRFKETVSLLRHTHEERWRLSFHNVLFQVIFYIFCFFVLTSTGSLLGAGLVMASALHLLTHETVYLLEGKVDDWQNWFSWPLGIQINLSAQKFFLILMWLIFLGLNLFLI